MKRVRRAMRMSGLAKIKLLNWMIHGEWHFRDFPRLLRKKGVMWSRPRMSLLNGSFDLESHFLVLRDAGFSMGVDGRKPQMQGVCSLMNLAGLIS